MSSNCGFTRRRRVAESSWIYFAEPLVAQCLHIFAARGDPARSAAVRGGKARHIVEALANGAHRFFGGRGFLQQTPVNLAQLFAREADYCLQFLIFSVVAGRKPRAFGDRAHAGNRNAGFIGRQSVDNQHLSAPPRLCVRSVCSSRAITTKQTTRKQGSFQNFFLTRFEIFSPA